MKQIYEVHTWRQVTGLAGAVMCETRDLGIKWPMWHTLMSEGQVAVGREKDEWFVRKPGWSAGRDRQQSTSVKN